MREENVGRHEIIATMLIRVLATFIYRTRKHMAEEFGENLVNEQQLFHGTQTDAIRTICRDGLDWRMCGENGVSFGQGEES